MGQAIVFCPGDFRTAEQCFIQRLSQLNKVTDNVNSASALKGLRKVEMQNPVGTMALRVTQQNSKLSQREKKGEYYILPVRHYH